MANLLEKASIILTPTAYSDGKMHSAKPIVSTNPSVGDFDFARASVATRVNEQGLLEEVASGLPRIDYTDGSGSWLLEPSSTNLVTYSEDFSNASWNTTSTRSMTISPSTVLDLRGGTDAFRITSTASDNQLASFKTITSGLNYTNSIYVRRVSGIGTVTLRDVNGISNAVPLSESDGWKRIETSVLSNSTSGRFYLNLSTVGDVIDVWGAQLEENSYATSYIKNAGTALGVTRVADTASGSGNSTVINSSEGVLYFEGSFKENAINQQLTLSNGTTAERIVLEVRNSGQLLRFNVRSIDVNSVEIDQAITANTPYKLALLWSGSVAKFYLNGSLVNSDSSVTIPIGLNSLSFDSGTSSVNFYSKTKSVQVYTTALSDAELTSLTTI